MQIIHLFNVLSILSVSALAVPATPDAGLYNAGVDVLEPAIEARTFKPYRQSCKANYQGGYWTAPVTIGGQTKSCKIDTSSPDVLVFDNSFSSSVRSSVGFGGFGGFLGGFFGGIKGGLSVVGGASWGFDFGAGLGFSGSVYKSVVGCGGLVVKGMQFGCLNKKASVGGGLDFSGVLGLGFQAASVVKGSVAGSFIEQAPANTVGCVFRNQNPYIEFGGEADASVYTGALVNLDIDNSGGYWTAGGLSYKANGKTCGKSSGGYKATLDTSSSYCSFPNDVAKSYYAQVAGAYDLSPKKDGSQYGYPCALASSLPAFGIAAGAGGSLSIPGSYLASGVSIGTYAGVDMCLGGIQGGVQAGAAGTLGFPFFASNYAHFDLDGPSVGCAPYKGQSSPPSGYGYAEGVGAGLGYGGGAGRYRGSASGRGGFGGRVSGGGFFGFGKRTNDSSSHYDYTYPNATGTAKPSSSVAVSLPTYSAAAAPTGANQTSPVIQSSGASSSPVHHQPAALVALMAAVVAAAVA